MDNIIDCPNTNCDECDACHPTCGITDELIPTDGKCNQWDMQADGSPMWACNVCPYQKD